MKKVILIVSFMCVNAWAQGNRDQEDPILWNINNIKRTHQAYEEGGATLGDLRSAIQQASSIVKEQEAEQSTWAYVQEYYPKSLNIACFVAGAAVMYVLNS